MKLSALIRPMRKLLFPIGWIYGLIVFIRNRAFDWGWLQQTPFSVPVIVVGNITVGGTGKTPVTEFIIDTLYPEHRIGLLSRGYGRMTKGVVYADEDSTSQSIGDEPFQIRSNFPLIETCVAEKRVLGAQKLIEHKVEVIVCDDAFQHRYLKPTKAIVVIDYNRPLWSDLMLPAGELREACSEISRADAVIVNKCPGDLSLSYKDFFLKKIVLKPTQDLFFTTIQYGEPKKLEGGSQNFPEHLSVVALAGIAQPQPFYDYLEKRFNVIDKITFPDHHNFTSTELDKIALRLQKIKGEFVLITTEKDASRLKLFPTFKYSAELWFLPIKIEFLFGEDMHFKKIIKSYVDKDKRDHIIP